MMHMKTTAMRSASLMLATVLSGSATAVIPSTQPMLAHSPTTQPDSRFRIVMGPATQPAAQPVARVPATQPDVTTMLGQILKDPAVKQILDNPSTAEKSDATTQPAAALILDQMDAAYARLSSVEYDGHIVGSFDVEGEQKNYDEPFTSSFSAPNKFRHDVANDILLGSTGTDVYSFLSDRFEYQTTDAPKTRGVSKDWPASITSILANQNPALLLTMCKSAGAELYELSRQITLEPVSVIDGVKYDTLRFDVGDDHQIITMLVDPNTHLLHQVQFDQRQPMEKAGALDVKSALITVTYTHSIVDVAASADQFAWSAPAGAVQASASVAMADASDGLSDELKSLIGKPAPNFTLSSLDDTSVTLSTQKGSVVVLDFWATWCGPCVASLPHLNSLYQQQGRKGLRVFGLNQQEKKGAVSTFVQKKGWTIPILLDSDAGVAGTYKVTGIPQTVIVGKDGTVKQIYVGSGHEKEIAARVTKEMQ